MPTTIADIRDFLSLGRIALVDVSRNPKELSRMLFREMCHSGYEIIPVNPAMAELEGRPCFARVQDIKPRPEGALIMTAPPDTERVVRNCAEAGIRHVWMHRAGGQGSVSPGAVEFCHDHGIHLVEGYCPFMFLPNTSLIHRMHGFFVKMIGAYPR